MLCKNWKYFETIRKNTLLFWWWCSLFCFIAYIIIHQNC